ncbi:MAG: lipopolysaccharide kinase InaA family protein [Methylobacillus sp.]|jgi:tRNA A-37 threonylcarbamoyl transferase component Bud32|nr:lipopolysaccharide kinase InaA family protein [Methylobacillus sp.]
MTSLDHISREGGVNFEVALEHAPPLQCQHVARRVPGRRIVCSALWQGRAVYAKLFIGEKAARYANRDARGAKALMERGLPTPELLHQCAIAGEQGQALIFAFVPESRNLEEVWNAAGPRQRHVLADKLARAVAAHHAAGVVQTDLYLRNFLLAADVLYTLDGDGIRVHPEGVSREAALENFALLLSKLNAPDDVRTAEWLALYAQARDWDGPIPLQELQTRVRAVRYRTVQKFVARKVLRDCTDIFVERRFNRYLAVTRAEMDDDLKRVIENPDSFFQAPDSAYLKRGNTCTIVLAQSGERRVVIKRYNIKNLRHAVGRAWRPTRASVSWSNAHMLRAFEIPTPMPLALIERRWGVLRREAWLLMDYAEGADIADVLADASLSDEQKQDAAVQTANLLYQLRLLRIEHGDMKADNIRWVDGAPMLLDLDAMRLHRDEYRFAQRHERDLRRFLKNWNDAPEILERVKSALRLAYGNDPLLARVGVEKTDETTSENL